MLRNSLRTQPRCITEVGSTVPDYSYHFALATQSAFESIVKSASIALNRMPKRQPSTNWTHCQENEFPHLRTDSK